MPSVGPFLVVGASGPTGGVITRQVSNAGGAVRGLCRSESGVPRARDAGATEIAVADLRDYSALVRALVGARGAFYLCPRAEPDEAALGRAFIRACEEAGVPRVVVLSKIQPHAPVPNHEASLQVEAALARSQLETVVLQLPAFMQILPSLKEIARDGWIGRPYAVDKPLTWVDLVDVGEVAARALLEDDLVNGTFELASPGMHSLADVASLIAEHLGQPIQARRIPLAEWAALRNETFSSPYREECYRAMFEYFDHYGFKGGNAVVLRHLLRREPTTWPGFIARGGRSASMSPVQELR